jgi:hypothetical protein
MVSQREIIQFSYALVFMDLVCWVDFLHEMFIYFSILVSGLCVLHHDFIVLFCRYLPLTKPGLRCLCLY